MISDHLDTSHRVVEVPQHPPTPLLSRYNGGIPLEPIHVPTMPQPQTHIRPEIPTSPIAIPEPYRPASQPTMPRPVTIPSPPPGQETLTATQQASSSTSEVLPAYSKIHTMTLSPPSIPPQ